MRTVVVTGSRDWDNERVINKALSMFHENSRIDLLVEGGARGADTLCRKWAEANGVESKTYPANWKAFGNYAGTKRNCQMLDAHPGAHVIAFPLPTSKGTMHCMLAAAYRKMTVWKVKPSGEWELVSPIATALNRDE
jgi:hypothetical protein